MKLKLYTVRKARMTGYTGKNRKRKGCIYLKEDQIGKRVLIVSIQEYRKLNKIIRLRETKFNKIQKIVKEIK